MPQMTFEQECVIASQGEQKFIVVQKKHHTSLKSKDLLNRKLKVTIKLETL